MLDALGPGRRVVLPAAARRPPAATDRALAEALWDLVWAGRVTNDTFAPLRALTGSGSGTHRTRRAAAPGPAEPGRRPARAADDHRSLGAAARARHRPDPARPRDRRADARAARRGHPRRGDVRAHARRVRGGLQGALGVRGLRPLPPRLLRRGPRRRPVRHRRGGRPAPHLRRGSAATRRASPRPSPWPRPTRPTRSARPCPWPEPRGLRRPPARAARPAPWWSSSTARSTLYVERGGRTLLTWSDDAALLGPAALSLSEAGPPRRAGPADRREGRRRADPRRRARRRCARRSTPPASSRRRGG